MFFFFFVYALEDMNTRRVREQQVEAARSLGAIDAALAADGETLLNAVEHASILKARDHLASLQSSTDLAGIESAIKALEKAAETYVERRMNASIQAMMAGHRIDEFKG